jgi:hypothetical protein
VSNRGFVSASEQRKRELRELIAGVKLQLANEPHSQVCMCLSFCLFYQYPIPPLQLTPSWQRKLNGFEGELEELLLESTKQRKEARFREKTANGLKQKQVEEEETLMKQQQQVEEQRRQDESAKARSSNKISTETGSLDVHATSPKHVHSIERGSVQV